MKKKLPLYILLLFLIVVNVFFLFNYIEFKEKSDKQVKRPRVFLIEELSFDSNQQKQFEVLEKEHHDKMQLILKNVIGLKNELFNSLSNRPLAIVDKDSVATLIGKNEARKELEMFRFFKEVKLLCDNKQKVKFDKIINDALKQGGRNLGPPPPRGRGDRSRLPPFHDHNRPEGNRPPPLH